MKKVLSIVLCFVMIFSITACSGNKTANENTTKTITDHAGNQVEIPTKIERIVVNGIYPLPSCLTVFFDSADKIVGMPSQSMLAAEKSILSELYPEILKADTTFTENDDINIESLIKLNPDIVFYSANDTKTYEKLKNAGIPGVGISVNKWGYNSIETLDNWISLLSEIFPENDKAEKVHNASNKIYELVQERTKNLSDNEKAKVFFLFQYSENNILTSGDNFFGDWWADAIGAKNVAKELKGDNAQAVRMEQIYGWDPEIIFVTNFTKAMPDDLYNNTTGNFDWSKISAVTNKKVYKMPLGMYRSYTPGVDTPITLLYLAKATYPELFKDIDITEETVKYYKDVFGINLTQKQASQIFNPLNAGFDK